MLRDSETFVVTKELLNPVGTLAAPRMLAAARRVGLAALSEEEQESALLASYSAEFKEGAREGEEVRVSIEPTPVQWEGDRAFTILFSKAADTSGRVGKWSMAFTKRKNVRPVPYNIDHAIAGGLTNQELWQSGAIIATGDEHRDAQLLLWPIGQSARAYMKRLDQEFCSTSGVAALDDIEQRIYAGVAVTTTMLTWPAKETQLLCALHPQRPLAEQPRGKRLEFHGVLVGQSDGETSLLGTCRFTVSRLNGRKVPIYADGSGR